MHDNMCICSRSFLMPLSKLEASLFALHACLALIQHVLFVTMSSKYSAKGTLSHQNIKHVYKSLYRLKSRLILIGLMKNVGRAHIYTQKQRYANPSQPHTMHAYDTAYVRTNTETKKKG